MPISEEYSVPFKFHRYIIGQKGAGVRKLMEDFDVNIGIPPPEQNSDAITVSRLVLLILYIEILINLWLKSYSYKRR